MFWQKRTQEDRLSESVRSVVTDLFERWTFKVDEDLEGLRTAGKLQSELTALKESIERLRIEKDRKEEEFKRREREVEHMVGLERKRQEFEIEQARREAVVEVKEQNLTADKQRFSDEMKFQREHLQSEIESLRALTAQLLERLPSAEIIAHFGGKRDE